MITKTCECGTVFEYEPQLAIQIKESIPSLAWTIIKKAYKRGDFKRK